MTKMKNLSIGNKVLYNEQIVTISSINNQGIIHVEELSDIINIVDLKGVPITGEFLIELGFTFSKNLIVSGYYSLDISIFKTQYKALTFCIDKHNQYGYIRYGEKLNGNRLDDDLITIFNSDSNGELYMHYMQNLCNIFKNS
jgi:hypothetical protein